MPVVRLVAQQYAVSVILLIGDCTVEHVIIAAVTPSQGPAVFGCMQQQCWILFALRFFVVAESMPVVPTFSKWHLTCNLRNALGSASITNCRWYKGGFPSTKTSLAVCTFD